MRFGTLVLVQRGGSPASGTPGCLRHVRGVLVGALRCERRVRLLEDDPLDTVGWNKKGQIGWWSCSAVKPMEEE